MSASYILELSPLFTSSLDVLPRNELEYPFNTEYGQYEPASTLWEPSLNGQSYCSVTELFNYWQEQYARPLGSEEHPGIFKFINRRNTVNETVIPSMLHSEPFHNTGAMSWKGKLARTPDADEHQHDAPARDHVNSYSFPILPAPVSPDDSSASLSDVESDDADSVNDNGSDDEYVPLTKVQECKRRRCSPSKTLRRSATLSSVSPTSRRARLSPPSRNMQASFDMMAKIEKALKSPPTNYVCPVCLIKMKSNRTPDFKRHMRTHLRSCKDERREGFQCNDCGVSFSRNDALKRHWDNNNNSCRGIGGKVRHC